MLRTYKYPEVPDQDKPDSGVLTFGLQIGKSVNPLPFFATGNNSAITSFTAVEFDQFRKEVGRISLDTSLIDVDTPNNIYNVDGLTNYIAFLQNGIYRFEFENDSNLWTTEYFKVINYAGLLSFTIDTSLGTGNSFQLPLPVTGNYNFIINWGDGNQDIITSYNQAETLHNYASPFTGEVIITGLCEGWYFNNTGDKLKITSVNELGGIGLKDVTGAFFGCTNLTTLNIGNWDTINVTDFSNFIRECTSLIILNTTNWNTTSVTNFSNFADGCVSLTTLNVVNWNTTSVTNFSNFISNCGILTTLNVLNWATQNVINFSNFADGCVDLTTLNVANWDTGNVVNFSFFAQACENLTTLNVLNWDTDNVTDFSNFITDCLVLIILNTTNWNTDNVTDFSDFANGCGSLTSFFEPAKFWTRTIPVPDFINCFTDALLISNYGDIPNVWKGLLPAFEFSFTIDTALGTGNSFQLPLPSGSSYNFIVYWGDGHQNTITSYNQAETLHNYSGAFTGNILIDGTCEGWSFNNGGDKLKITSVNKLGGIGLKDVTGAFFGCTNLTILDVLNWDTTDVTDFSRFIQTCSALVTLNTTNWNTDNVNSFELFAEACGSLTSFFEPTKYWTRTIPVPSFDDCFADDLLISNYADIPNNWKGL